MDVVKGIVVVAVGFIIGYFVVNTVSVNCVDFFGNKACAVVVSK